MYWGWIFWFYCVIAFFASPIIIKSLANPEDHDSPAKRVLRGESEPKVFDTFIFVGAGFLWFPLLIAFIVGFFYKKILLVYRELEVID